MAYSRGDPDAEGGYALLLTVAAAMFGMLAYLLSTLYYGRWGFFCALLMGLCIDGALWFAVVKNDMRSFALKAGFVGGAIVRIFPIGMCLSLPLANDYLFPWGEYLYTQPLVAAFGATLRSFAIAAIYLLTRPMVRHGRFDVPVKGMIEHTSNRFEAFLIIAGIVKVSYWISVTGLDNPLFYFGRIMNTALAFVPFIVGYGAFVFKKATLFWIGILIFEVGVSFLTGTRGAAFMAILFFTLGFFLGLPSWHSRLRWGVILAPVGVALLAAAVYIGAVRDVVGRTDLKTALLEGSIMEAAEDTVTTANIDMGGGIAYKGFRRLTGWASYVIPTMTPDPVPYRGFGDFIYEVRSTANLGIFALLSPGRRAGTYFSNIHLNPYGFPVHVDEATGIRTSNAPMPVQVDGFTRGGWLAAFAYVFIAYAVAFAVERFLRHRLLPSKQPLFLMMLTFLCYITTSRFGSISLIHSLRQLVLEGVLCFILFFVADRFLKKIGQVEKPLKVQ